MTLILNKYLLDARDCQGSKYSVNSGILSPIHQVQVTERQEESLDSNDCKADGVLNGHLERFRTTTFDKISIFSDVLKRVTNWLGPKVDGLALGPFEYPHRLNSPEFHWTEKTWVTSMKPCEGEKM